MMDPLSCARTIGETVKAIKKAVDTVKKNRKDCEEISSYADLAGNLIEKLKETGMIEYPVTHLPLKALATSLERARERIKECQQKPDVIHLVVAGDQSARLREAMQDIAWKMMLVNLATSTYGNEISLDIQRQVRLQNQTGPPQHTGGAPHPLPQPQDPPVLVFVGKLHGAPWQQQHGFDLQDLLRASAVGLGKGSLGASFKVTLENGTDVVVKRLRDVAASREEFAACVEATGAVDHRNLAPVRGYAYSEDEKLLVGDYFPAGSLSARLHGNRGADDRTPMDWEARMRAALCAAHGLAHLHTVHGLAHGNIKSSNLLLRTNEPDAAALSDYGLNQLFAPVPSAGGGYHAPELTDMRRPTFKSDMYSLGVLFLELITGKCPNDADGDDTFDLPRWVLVLLRDKWVPEVFDDELRRLGLSAEEEMVQLLQLAINCLNPLPEARPEAENVVKRIEDIRSEHGRTTTGGGEGMGGAEDESRSIGATP